MNYLEDEIHFFKFKSEFEKRFGNSNNLENMEVVFTCGYFWKLHDAKRKTMLLFIVNTLLRKGVKVSIWTQDKDLKNDFDEVFKKQSANSVMERNLHIHRVPYRIDIHYTLAKDNNNLKNSFFSIELPHSEAYIFRLETLITFEKLMTFCDINKFMKCLSSHLKMKFIRKRLLWWLGYALNS